MTSSPRQAAVAEPIGSSRRLVHLRELDGVRGLAAILVFFRHVCFVSIPAVWNAPVRLLIALSFSGSYGVDLFFVLSGFLITSLLIEAQRRPSYYHDFYWKRTLRILPLYIVCLLGVFLFVPNSQSYVILSALFVSNFAWLFHIVSIGPFWTLAIEEQFYLIWPTVIRRRSIEQISRWAICIGLMAVVLRLIASSVGHYNFIFTFFHCDGLAFGAFLACWFYRRDPLRADTRRENLLMALGASLGIFLIALSIFSARDIRVVALFASLRQTGITLLFGSLIASVVTHTGSRGLGFLRSPLLTFFGLISYAMYMVHLYVLMLYDHIYGPMRPGDNATYIVRFMVVFSATVTLCLISRYLIELPAMSLRKHVLARPAPADPTSAPLLMGNM